MAIAEMEMDGRKAETAVGNRRIQPPKVKTTINHQTQSTSGQAHFKFVLARAVDENEEIQSRTISGGYAISHL
jgi:hypothetical protein